MDALPCFSSKKDTDADSDANKTPAEQEEAKRQAELNAPIARWYDGAWPMLQDKIRGGTRSRVLLTLIYTYLTMIVMLVLVVSIVPRDTNQDTVSFVEPPPTRLLAGGVVPRVSVVVRNAIGKGLGARRVALEFTPLSILSLKTLPVAAANGGVATGALDVDQLNCVRNGILHQSILAQNQRPLCHPYMVDTERVPATAAAVSSSPSNATTVSEGVAVVVDAVADAASSFLVGHTDDKGFAHFRNVSIPGAFAGQYLVRVVSFDINDPTLQVASQDRIVTMTVPTVTSLSAIATRSNASAAALNNLRPFEVAVTEQFNVSIAVSVSLPAGLASFAPEPAFVGAAVFGGDVMSTLSLGTDVNGMAVSSPYMHGSKALVALRNNVAVVKASAVRAAATFPVNFTSAATVTYNFTVPFVAIDGVTKPIFHIAVAVLGAVHVIDIESALTLANMVPRRLVPPLRALLPPGLQQPVLSRPVAQLVSGGRCLTQGVVSVVEGAEVAVVIRVESGDPTALRAALSGGWRPQATLQMVKDWQGLPRSGLQSAPETPSRWKSLLVEVVSDFSVSDDGSELTLTGVLRASVAGTVGSYRVFAVGFGQEALWLTPRQCSTLASNATETSQVVAVMSAVGSATVTLQATPWLPQDQIGHEVLFAPFSSLPTVRVRDSNRAALRGKRATVFTFDHRYTVTADSSESDADGDITFNFVSVMATTAPTGQNVTFNVAVDGVIWASFERVIDFASGITEQARLVPAIALARTTLGFTRGCVIADAVEIRHDVVVSAATNVAVDAVTLRALDVFGEPVANAQINVWRSVGDGVDVDPAFFQSARSNASGLVTFTLNTPRFTDRALLGFTAACDELAQSPSVAVLGQLHGVVSLRRRLGSIAGISTSSFTATANASTSATLQSATVVVSFANADVDWDLVTATDPLTVFVFAIWSPAFISGLYPVSSQFTNTSVALLTEPPANGIVTLTIATGTSTAQRHSALPGLSVYTAFADTQALNEWVPFTGREAVASLQLVQSAVDALPPSLNNTAGYTGLAFGDVFPVQPVVRALDEFGAPVSAGIVVFAQLGVVVAPSVATDDADDDAVQWIDISADASLLRYGYISDGTTAAAFSPSNQPRAPVSTTNASGVAAFTALAIEGAVVDRVIRLRYCYADALPRNRTSSSVALATICVEEPRTFMFPSYRVVVAVADIGVISLVPGAYVPALNLTVTSSLQPRAVSVATASSSNTLVTRSGDTFMVPAGGFGSASSSVQIKSRTFAVSSSIVNAVILQELYVPGATVTLSILVSNAASALELVLPPPVAAGVTDLQSIAVRVSGASSLALPGQKVSVTTTWQEQSDAAEATCEGSGCGVQASVAVLSALTDASGIANLKVAFKDVSSGTFQYKFKVEPAVSSLGALQDTLAADVGAIESSFGSKSALSVGLDASEGDTTAIEGALTAVSDASFSRLASAFGDLTIDAALVASLVSASASALADPAAASAAIGLAELATVGTSDAGEKAVMTTSSVEIYNPVTTVEIVEFPVVSQLSTVPSASAANSSYHVSFTYLAPGPIVRFRDQLGAPVPNVPATVYIEFEPSDADVRLILPDGALESDAEGLVTLVGTSITTSTDLVDVKVFVRSRGSPSNQTSSLRLEITRRSLTDTLQILALVMVILFIPLFLSSVAYSRRLYLFAGVVFAIVMAFFTVVYVAVSMPQYRNNTMVAVFFGLLGAVAVVTALLVIVMTATQLSSDRLPRLRVWNAEERATSAFHYTVWLVAERVDAHEIEPEVPISVRLAAFAKSAKARVIEAFATSSDDDDGNGGDADDDAKPQKAARKVDASEQGDGGGGEMEMTSVGNEPVSRRASEVDPNAIPNAADDDDEEEGRMHNPYLTKERPPLIKPDDVPDPVSHPQNLFVVVSITTVLLLVIIFFNIQIMLDAQRLLTTASNALPQAPDDPEVARNASKKMTQALVFSIEAVAAADSNLGFLREVIGPLQEFDWFAALSDVRLYISGVNERIEASFITGMVSGTLIVVASMVYIWVVTPSIIRDMRRGLYNTVPVYNEPEPFRIEQFVGLFVFHYVALYMMVCFIIIVIVLVLSVDVLRSWIFWQIYTAFLASLGSLILTYVLRFFQQLFLMDGTFVVRPRVYATYSFLDLILGVFTGLINTITRVAMALGFIIVTFAKLDETIFPITFAWLDLGLIGFSSLLTMEARNANPVMLSAASWMLTDQAIRRTVAQHHARRVFLATAPTGASVQSIENPPGCEEDGAAVKGEKVSCAGVVAGDAFIASEVRDMVEDHIAAVDGKLGTVPSFNGTQVEWENTAVGDYSLNPDVWKGVSLSTPISIRIGSFGQRVRMPSDPRRTSVDVLPINGTMLPSPIMITFGQLWLRWLSEPQLRPIEPWLRPDDPYINASTPHVEDDENNSKVAKFDATAYVRRQRGANSRMARKWHLTVMLLRNPSLVKHRKHFLPKPLTEEQYAERENQRHAAKKVK